MVPGPGCGWFGGAIHGVHLTLPVYVASSQKMDADAKRLSCLAEPAIEGDQTIAMI
jgi:hypothetical protein